MSAAGGGVSGMVEHRPALGNRAPEILRKRADFVAAQRGRRRHTRFFTLQIRARQGDVDPPRFGITVTKKVAAEAVRRNRIRRRLRAVLRMDAVELAQPGFDYVLIARLDALAASFADLRNAVIGALTETNRRPADQTLSGASPRTFSGASSKDRPSTP